MIVDVHTHIVDASLHLSAEFKADLDASWKGHTIHAPPEIHRQAVDDVDAIIVFPLNAPYSGIVVPNEYVAAYVRGAGENVIGFASVDANDPEAPDQLAHAVKQLGLRGLKIGPIYQGYDPLSDGALAMFAKAAALGIPIMWHHGTTFVRKAPLKFAQPWQVDEVAMRFPDLKIIVAHMGHPGDRGNGFGSAQAPERLYRYQRALPAPLAVLQRAHDRRRVRRCPQVALRHRLPTLQRGRHHGGSAQRQRVGGRHGAPARAGRCDRGDHPPGKS